VAMPLVAVNQKDGGNHGAGNAGPRRVPRRRSRARYCPVRRASAQRHQRASLAPTLGAARSMEGPEAVAPEARHWLKLSAPLESHPPHSHLGTGCGHPLSRARSAGKLHLGAPGSARLG
jgi:hypothetical protein